MNATQVYAAFPSGGRYALDNDKPTAHKMLTQVSTICNELSQGVLERAGLAVGARCLELGAGDGSMAAWMADQVGPGGRVVAVDIKPQHIEPHPGVEVVQGDVVTDELPAGPFDVIHARLLLNHLPQRLTVLDKMIRRLAAGGVIAVGSWGGHHQGRVLSAPQETMTALQRIYSVYKGAFLEVLASRGNDPMWGMRAHQDFLDRGLRGVQTIGGPVQAWVGGTAGCRLPIVVSTQLQDDLVRQGMTLDELTLMRSGLGDERTVVLGDQMAYTVGYLVRDGHSG